MLYAHVPWPIFCSLIWLISIDVWYCSIVSSQISKKKENRHNQASFNLHTSLLCQFVKVLAGCFGALQDTSKALSRYDDLGVPKDPIQVPTKALLTWANMTSESFKKWHGGQNAWDEFWKDEQKTNETRKKYLKYLKKTRNGIWFTGSCESCCAKGKETQDCQLARHLPSAAMCYMLPHCVTCYR